MYKEGSAEHREVIEYLDSIKVFTVKELTCSCGCGSMLMDLTFLKKLFKIRKKYGVAMNVSSGYRCKNHPEERKKTNPILQTHTEGIAVDVLVNNRSERARLVRIAHEEGLKGVGLAETFVHLDDRDWDALYNY